MSEQASPERRPLDTEAVESSPGTDGGGTPKKGRTKKGEKKRIVENVKELFWCDARDEQGHLQHAPDCEQ